MNAAPSKVLIPGLSWPHAVASDLAARAVASTIPGPTDLATRFILYRQWRIPTDTASAGIVFAAFFETTSALVLPLIAGVGVVLSGRATRPGAVGLALVGLAILIVATLILVAMVRNESFARKVGQGLDWLARHIWPIFRKPPPTGIVDNVLEVRERSKDMLSRHGMLGFAAAVGAKLAWFIVFEIALWSVGLGPDEVPPSSVLAAMGIVAIVALIPITPGAVGVTEVAYIGTLTAAAGEGFTEQITAAVLLFRIAQWLAVIPIGWILLIILRWGHTGGLLGSDEPAGGEETPSVAAAS
jgi:uncharacterized protein (TIRG00374 family)